MFYLSRIWDKRRHDITCQCLAAPECTTCVTQHLASSSNFLSVILTHDKLAEVQRQGSKVTLKQNPQDVSGTGGPWGAL